MSESRPETPRLKALRDAIDRLRQAPMFEKAKHAEQAASLSLTLLEDQDRRIGNLELRLEQLANTLGRSFDRRRHGATTAP